MTSRPGQPKRRALRFVLPALFLVVAGAVALYLHRSLAFEPPGQFWTEKGELAAADARATHSDSAYEEYELTLESSAGYRVRGYLRAPRRPGPWPAIIVLGGIDTGKMAARLINPDHPHVILGLDYPWEGSTRLTPVQFLMRVLAVRRAMLLTPSAVMLAIDYLETREEVADRPVSLVGASFGAPLATVAAALDDRTGPLILVYGGGDFEELIAANLPEVPGPIRRPVARIGAWLIKPIEPLRYVSAVAPHPVILINGKNDDRIPRYCVETLFSAAGDPKRLIWLDTGHISSRNEELLNRVLDAAVSALDDLRDGGLRNAG